MRILDTNILLRYFTGDDQKKAQKVFNLLKRVESGEESLLVSPSVIFETIFTLESFYKLKRREIQELLSSVLIVQNFKLDDKDIYFEALEIYCNKNISFADAFIAAFALKKNIDEIYSYDKDFDKFDFVKRIEP